MVNVTLIAPTDFTEISDQLTFPSGATTGSTVCSSTIVRNDILPEINETFMVRSLHCHLMLVYRLSKSVLVL